MKLGRIPHAHYDVISGPSDDPVGLISIKNPDARWADASPIAAGRTGVHVYPPHRLAFKIGTIGLQSENAGSGSSPLVPDGIVIEQEGWVAGFAAGCGVEDRCNGV